MSSPFKLPTIPMSSTIDISLQGSASTIRFQACAPYWCPGNITTEVSCQLPQSFPKAVAWMLAHRHTHISGKKMKVGPGGHCYPRHLMVIGKEIYYYIKNKLPILSGVSFYRKCQEKVNSQLPRAGTHVGLIIPAGIPEKTRTSAILVHVLKGCLKYLTL